MQAHERTQYLMIRILLRRSFDVLNTPRRAALSLRFLYIKQEPYRQIKYNYHIQIVNVIFIFYIFLFLIYYFKYMNVDQVKFNVIRRTFI